MNAGIGAGGELLGYFLRRKAFSYSQKTHKENPKRGWEGTLEWAYPSALS
jgi:hypothetical protein